MYYVNYCERCKYMQVEFVVLKSLIISFKYRSIYISKWEIFGVKNNVYSSK